MSKRTIVIAAGGTGGHLFPAAAFAEEMRQRGWRVVLMTDARGRRYAENFPAERVEDVPAASLSANPIAAIPALLKIWRGVNAAKARFRELKPALVAGFGGYPSFPALVAARGKIPILIHEQNAVLGRVNRAMAGDAAAVACGFERLDRLPPKARERKYVVGNPVRAPIVAVRERAYPDAPAGGRLNLLVIGGSQGARIFGEVVPEAIELLPADLRARIEVVQQVREEQLAAVRQIYAEAGLASAEAAAFFTDMGERLARAHLVISRAGASSVTELQTAGRPAILIPFAAAADDHQRANAEGLTSVGAADVLSEAQASPRALADLLALRLGDPHGLAVRAAAARSAGKPDAAKTLADLAESVAA